MLSTLVLPLPEEATLLYAGWLAHLGRMSLLAALLAGASAVVVGDLVTYGIGRFLLERLLRTRLGRKVLPESSRRWAEAWVSRHGVRAVLLARFLVALRGPVYLAIGTSRYPAGRFLAIDAAAALVETSIVLALGWTFGRAGGSEHRAIYIELAIGVSLVVSIAAPFVFRRFTGRAT